ncbi:MAG: primosomal protein N' [Alphaproteobacteria bacterium]|nr:primosomal protein N' [Alphaproteobacteria bacterium]MCL2758550.1 primosomal protein N' [Alphaproteobacteria bacterium]
MFNAGDIVCVLIPNAVNNGYDYRLSAPAKTGQFVQVSVMNRPYTGVIIGPGTSALPPEKIKPVQKIYDWQISARDLKWIMRMSEWTMMAPGAVLKLIVNVPEAFAPPKLEPTFALCARGVKAVRMTEQRQAVADAFASNDSEPMTAPDIQNIARVSPAVVRTMIKNGILAPVGEQQVHTARRTPHTYRDTGAITLNPEQQAAADAMTLDKFGVHVLDGITGSGKTQVYFDTAWRAYAAGKSVLLMMPEIALTAQFMSRFAEKFGAAPIVWHSNLTTAKRRDIWRGVASGDIRIVVGTRSALFLPWQNLGLTVVDEEHDASYKQEDMGNYHARDMAILRGSISDFPIILASATPSAETIKKINEGAYKCSRLSSRFGGATMPTIELIDMRKNTPGELSPALSDAITGTLAANQQIMLFINRRGFAPIVRCIACGWHADCPDCSIGQTLHKKIGKLLCHCCGKTTSMPQTCPDCNSAEVLTTGTGVEKIAAEVAERWPAAKCAIVSSDTMMSRQALERLVARMESGELNIIIGTQILAKGHHFPNLTLVGAVDADMGLFGADFRSGERTFQQLFQVAGRAGRGTAPGRVMLQTYQPEHPVLKAIAAADRDTLMAMDLDARRRAGMPPYGQLIALVVECEKENVLQKFCAALAAAAPQIRTTNHQPRTTIMGPIPAQIYQIRNWYRMRFLVSGPERAALQPAVANWLSKVKVPSNIKIKIDVNPQSFI